MSPSRTPCQGLATHLFDWCEHCGTTATACIRCGVYDPLTKYCPVPPTGHSLTESDQCARDGCTQDLAGLLGGMPRYVTR